MPRKPRRIGIKRVLEEIGTIEPVREPTSPTPASEEETPVEEKSNPTPASPTFSFTVPADKVTPQLREVAVGEEITLQITGNVASSDETGVVIDVKTVEVV